MNILGIDPGAGGALAFYCGDELLIYDMPVFAVKKGKTIRNRVDFRGVVNLIDMWKPDYAFIENVSAQFGNGAAAAFSFGRACEAVENAVITCDVPFTMVTSQSWKKALECPAEKDGSRMRANQLMPSFAHNWPLKKHDGRAEAAMIAYYGMEKLK